MKYLLSTFIILATPPMAHGHFIWLTPGNVGGNATVNVYFGEDATDDNPEYLSRVKGVSVRQVTGTRAADKVTLTTTDNSIFGALPNGQSSVCVATHDLGVMDRSDSKFRLMYYAKTGPVATSKTWQSAICTDDLKLDIIPSLNGGTISLTVCFAEKPVSGVQVKAARPGGEDFEAETNADGIVTFNVADAGLYSIRARHIEATPGQLNGTQFLETRHYSTLSLQVDAPTKTTTSANLQDLPEPVTSFGAAIVDQALYMYGGHTGSAHSYSTEAQSNKLTMLNLITGRWSSVIKGPHLQGLALVTDGRKLYRIGGFTAKNAEGEAHQLVSQNSVASFEPGGKQWTNMPPLPEPRSSHDAAVVGNSIYVVGGWAMDAQGETRWHNTAWKLDLSQLPLHWQPIASPPFKRRAIATAAHDGELFVVGGMQDNGGPTTAVAIYDPRSNSWREGPQIYVRSEHTLNSKNPQAAARGSMDSGAMAGFGASAFATDGSLYATTVQGNLQRLSDNGSSWELVKEDISPRFFHRMLRLSEHELIVIGGSNMSTGKFEEVEVLNLRNRG